MTERAANVIDALAHVIADMPGIGKDNKSEQGYRYRGIEAITSELQELLGRHGVVFVPRVLHRDVRELTINNKPWTQDEIEVVYTVYGPGGVEDCIQVGPVIGLGRDNSDKGANKAMTQAFKYALLQTLCIGDAKDDGDQQTHEADEPSHEEEQTGWYGWADEATARAEHDRMAERIAAMPDDVKTAFREFRRQNSMGWPMSSAKWATFIEHANSLLTPQDPPEETPSPVSSGALPPAPPSHDEAVGTTGAEQHLPSAASAPVATISEDVAGRLRLRMNTLPDEQRTAVDAYIKKEWGALERVPETSVTAVGRLIDKAAKEAKTADGLAARAAGHANQESAA